MDLEAQTAAATRKVRCKLCQVKLAAGNLASHLKSQHVDWHCYLAEEVCPVATQSYKAWFMPAMAKSL